MLIPSRIILLSAVLLIALQVDGVVALASVASSEADRDSVTPWSWNLRQHEAPFIRQPHSAHASVFGPLVFSSGDFSFPLLQPLGFDSECDCYSLMLKQGTSRLELVNFWRTRAGFYRSGNGPYLELENLDSLKSVTALNGTRFLFSEVVEGEWRCVSIHDSLGNYLLIDYRADGLIGRIRDSLGRTATPAYNEGRMISLKQSWSTAAGQQVRITGIQ